MKSPPTQKTSWRGVLTAVQPRIRLTRSFDQRTHTYQGYALHVAGTIGHAEGKFIVAVGKVAHEKHQFRRGDSVSGQAESVADSRLEIADLYKVSKLTVVDRALDELNHPPPWYGIPAPLSVYRERGHRRLAIRTYETACGGCIWGCKMAVEMIIDQWNPRQRRYRTETFCYGPLSCRIYKPGPTRKVPGRRGMSYTEEDWVDQDATSHRHPDE